MATEYSSIQGNVTRAQFVGGSPAFRACLGLPSAIAAEHMTRRERNREREKKNLLVHAVG